MKLLTLGVILWIVGIVNLIIAGYLVRMDGLGNGLLGLLVTAIGVWISIRGFKVIVVAVLKWDNF